MPMPKSGEVVLVVGSGAREQAIARSLIGDSSVGRVIVAPGNPGSDFLSISTQKFVDTVPLPDNSVGNVMDVIAERDVGLVVVGPEEWLGKGLGNALAEKGIPAIAPPQEQAQLELSKAHARELARQWGVPQPGYVIFNDPEAAALYIRVNEIHAGVIKVSGPALGKGVAVCQSQAEMLVALSQARAKFGAAANEVLVEELLFGTEVSYIVLCDGENFVPFTPAMDYKRLKDNNQGPNTGGMGSIAPNPFVSAEVAAQIEGQIIRPIVDGMAARGTPYKGVLYAGIMLTKDGPKLIEINARMGDPETQVQLELLRYSLYQLFLLTASGSLTELTGSISVPHDQRASVSIVLAAEGYPDAPKRGERVYGVDAAEEIAGVTVYQAGTAWGGSEGDQLVSHGGRVVNVIATAKTLKEAVARANAAIGPDGVHFRGMQRRTDIGVLA